MKLPFTTSQFFEVFRDYNETLWPVQFVHLGLALAVIYLILKPRPWSGVAIAVILSSLWAWIGLAYHWAFFLRINQLAIAFAVISMAGSAVFLWQGVMKRCLQFRWAGNVASYIGAVLIIFSLAVYPAWSVVSGHPYPTMPTFGLPCPTTIFTIGVLAFSVPAYPRSPFIVPVVWSFVGTQAAFLLGVTQDLGLIVAGIVGLVLLFRPQSVLVKT